MNPSTQGLLAYYRRKAIAANRRMNRAKSYRRANAHFRDWQKWDDRHFALFFR
jgi:hypothetical protein